MNLINETHYSCEKREYAFIIFRKYTIISSVCVFVYWEILMSVLRALVKNPVKESLYGKRKKKKKQLMF